MSRIGAFESFVSRSGVLSARHCDTGILLHSGVDPLREAQLVAEQLHGKYRGVTLFGSGLGYLPAALAHLGVRVEAYEVFSGVADLAMSCTGFSSKLLESCDQISMVLEATTAVHGVVVSPYVSSLVNELPTEIRQRIEHSHVMSNSRPAYSELISANMVENKPRLSGLPALEIDSLRTTKPTAVIGAGPSLTPCAGSLKSYREELFVIAASGAVPSLLQYGVIPDLAVAMEAKPESAADIEDLPDESLIVVFPWTAPKVMRSGRSKMVVADETLDLLTSGGSTALAAADLAARLTTKEVYLLGMDLSDQLGTYAHGALREERHVSMNAAKWSVMRAAFDSWVSSLGYRKIFHVLQGTVAPLNGTTVLSPREFHAQLLPLREAITTA